MAILLEIPLKSIPNQTVSVNLNGQFTTFDIFLEGLYLFANVSVGSVSIMNGMKANHAVYLNQYVSIFQGYLFFYDDNGLDPVYTNLGTVSHLYFSDYDALALDFLAFENANKLPPV